MFLSCQALIVGEFITVSFLGKFNYLIFIHSLGVPRILEGTLPPHFMSELLPTSERESWVPYEQYMRTTRINVNARQVFPKDFDPGEAQEIG